jgi:hypothetical protein
MRGNANKTSPSFRKEPVLSLPKERPGGIFKDLEAQGRVNNELLKDVPSAPIPPSCPGFLSAIAYSAGGSFNDGGWACLNIVGGEGGSVPNNKSWKNKHFYGKTLSQDLTHKPCIRRKIWSQAVERQCHEKRT